MKKVFIACLVFAVNIFSVAAFGATGEYWEITSKMEMPGMPFAMPATTSKVCLPPGGEKDPNRTRDKSKNCEMTDVKTSGNKVSYKGKCVDKDGTMNMEGENTYERDSYSGVMHMTGKSHGRDMDMKTSYSGKRIGGSCDTEELGKKMQAQAKEQEKVYGEHLAKRCDTSGYSTSQWISSALLFIGSQTSCPGKKDALCQVVRNDVPRDLQAYGELVRHEQAYQKSELSIAKACNANLESMRVSLCKAKAHSGPQSFLDENCPAEAKAYRELARKRDACSGRGYTSGEDMKGCMSGALPDEEDGDEPAHADTKNAKPNKSKADSAQKNSDNSGKGDNPADAVVEGAKKLKGMFGF